MSVDEVASVLGVSKSMVGQLLDKDEMPWYQIGGYRKVKPSDLEKFLEEARDNPKRRPYRKIGKKKVEA